MEDLIRFGLLGLGVGSLYVLGAQGLIVIFRGSGILNFGLGAIGMVGVYVKWELGTNYGWSLLPSIVVGILSAAALGALVQVFIMRPLRHRSPLIRVIATLGVLLTLQSLAVLRYTAVPKVIQSDLPITRIELGNITISIDRFILLGIAAIVTVLLYLLSRFTKFGLGTSAVAESERISASLGWSPNRVAVINWALGSALTGLAAILIAPIVTLQPSVMTNLVLAATAAALVANFRSFPIALVAGLVIGILETQVSSQFASLPGIGQAVPFIFIILWMMFRGQVIPQRDYPLQRLPSIGSGRIRWSLLFVSVAIVGTLIMTASNLWADAYVVSIVIAIIVLSVVVVTGYTGQLSLAQFALAGFGAFVAGRTASVLGLPFIVALLIGVAATIPLGLLFALPAIRTRGINLAIATLGLGTSIELVIFTNQNLTGGIAGTLVAPPDLFGLPIDAGSHPGRYGLFALLCLVVITLMVGNLRRGRSGRRLIAVRANERAAAALGISVSGAKLYAFGVASGIAALGGILLAFRNISMSFTGYTSSVSISMLAYGVIGGVGYLAGPAFGGTMAQGGISARIMDNFGPGVGRYIPLIGGISVILLVLLNQDGVVKETIGQIGLIRGLLRKTKRPRRSTIIFLITVGVIFCWLAWLWGVWQVAVGIGLATVIKLFRELWVPPPPTTLDLENAAALARVEPRTLEVKDLSVRYGGTLAVNKVSLSIRAGKIVGLIGPNGAGKSSLIDAVTGFAKMSEGSLMLNGEDITTWSTVSRSRAGIGRSFQSLELFEDSSVIDNLRAASDPRDMLSYFRDLIYPVEAPLSAAVVSTVKEFKLTDDLDKLAEELPYGKRRLLAVARAVAGQPSVLLLDEPAAGLTDVESAELAHLVKRLAAEWGMAILLVEHDVNFVMSVCDEIVVLDFGTKISEGTPDVVRADPIVIAAYLGEDEPRGESAATTSSAVQTTGGLA